MKVKVELTGIVWDKDRQKVDLPKNMTVEVEREDGDTDENVLDQAVDAASDQTGWCIKSIKDSKIV